MAQVIILTGSLYVEDTIPRLHRTLGAYRVASALMQSGYSVQVIDYIQYMSDDELIKCIENYLCEETLWVGYSSTFFGMHMNINTDLDKMYFLNTEKLNRVISYVKNNSEAKIVYGGAYAIDRHYDSRVDYYVAGYADVSCVELTNFLANKTESLTHYQVLQNNCVLIDSAKYQEPPLANINTNWDHESFHLIPGEPISLEFARGCIFKCKFCNYPLLGKKKGTYIRDMNQVKDELISLWEKTGTDTFYITDDTFNDDNDKMENFHKLFTSLPFKPKFASFLRIDLIDRYPHQADLLLEAGLVGAFFGVESFNLKSARSIGKGLHPEKVKNRLSWIKEKWSGKANIGVGLIIGLPYDDDNYFRELEEYVTSKDYPIDQTSFNPLWIADPKRGTNVYSSEFSLNPEIYGYSFDENGHWIHDSGLTFEHAKMISYHFSTLVSDKVKPADFQVISNLALGIKLEDIVSLDYASLYSTYDIPKMNKEKIDTYKMMIGAV